MSSAQSTDCKWFIEKPNKPGEKQGPYSDSEILKMISQGILHSQNQLYNSDSDTWKAVAECFNTSQGWSPPPRPKIYQNYHVIGHHGDQNIFISDEEIERIDYFKLIHDRRSELEKRKVNYQARKEKDKAALSQEVAATEALNESSSEISKVLNSLKQKTEIHSKIFRFLTRNSSSTSTDPNALNNSDLAHGSKQADSNKLGDLTFSMPDSFSDFFSKAKGPALVAASLSFIFVGSFYVIRSYSQNKRIPATAGNATTSTIPAQNLEVPTKQSTETSFNKIRSNDTIGTGQNTAPQRHQSVARPTPRQVDTALDQHSSSNQNDSYNNNAPPREPAQYYSSSSPDAPPAEQPQFTQSQDTVEPPQLTPTENDSAQQNPASDPQNPQNPESLQNQNSNF